MQVVGALGTRATDLANSGGVLYCVSGSNKFFYEINLTTGAAIKLGDTGLPPQDGGALGADANGNIFGATLNNQTTGAITFYRYDLTNGAATVVGETGSNLFPRALTFDGELVGLEGGTLRNPSAARFIGIYDPVTGIWTQTGSTVAFADALVWVPIPEPSAWLLMVIGGAVLCATKSTKGRKICPRSCG